MEILPETFIGADGYHDRMTAVNRCWMVPFAYGLIPLHDFEIKYAIHDNNLTLEKISCMIMDCEGNVLHLTQGTTVPLPSTAQGTYYLTVSCGDFNHIEKNGVPYLEQKYKYQIINLLNPNSPSLFPLMKLHAGNGEWEVLDFIPPCCTVNTHPLLTDLTHQCGSLLEKILTLVEKNGNEDAYYQIGSLLVEMSDSVRSDTPSILITRLKKAVFILKTKHLLDEEDTAILGSAEEFVWHEYNPNLLFETLQNAIAIIHTAVAFLQRTKPEPAPVVEKPKSEPEEEEFTYML